MEITQIHSFIHVYTDINTQSQLRIDTHTSTWGKSISSNHYQLEDDFDAAAAVAHAAWDAFMLGDLFIFFVHHF